MPRKRTYSAVTEKKIFPSRLRKMMKKRGMNQEALAHLVSVQRQTISLYTIGQSKPDTDRLTAIAGALGVSADYLLGISDIESPDATTRNICEKTGLSETSINRLMSTSERNKTVWAEVIDQLLLQPRILDALHAYLFLDIDGFSTVGDDGKLSGDPVKHIALVDGKHGKWTDVRPDMMEGALQVKIQQGLSDLKQGIKKRRDADATEK